MHKTFNPNRNTLKMNIETVSKIFFWIGFVLVSGSYFYSSTLFNTLISIPISRILYIGYVVLLIRLILLQHTTYRRVLFMLIANFLSVIVWYFSRDTSLFTLTLVISAAQGISMRDMVKVHFFLILFGLLVTMALSYVNVIPDLLYYRGSIVRHSFGVIYPTDFASHVFYLYLTYCVLKRKNFSLIDFSIGMGLAFFVIKFNDARLDMIVIALTAIAFLVLKKTEGKRFGTFISISSITAFPLGLLTSYATSKFYNYSNHLLVQMNTILSNRLMLGNQALEQYPISFGGQRIFMNGYGGISGYNSIREIENYFMIDSSYLRILLIYGILGTSLAVFIYTLLSLKIIKKRDVFLSIAIILLCIHEVVAQFALNIGYNVFPLLIFSFYDFAKNDNDLERESI